MSRIVEHINQVAPEIGDLTIDQPTVCRWLPAHTAPVLATPTITYAVGVALAAVTYVTGDGGCSRDPDDPPCHPE